MLHRKLGTSVKDYCLLSGSPGAEIVLVHQHGWRRGAFASCCVEKKNHIRLLVRRHHCALTYLLIWQPVALQKQLIKFKVVFITQCMLSFRRQSAMATWNRENRRLKENFATLLLLSHVLNYKRLCCICLIENTNGKLSDTKICLFFLLENHEIESSRWHITLSSQMRYGERINKKWNPPCNMISIAICTLTLFWFIF